MAAPRWTSLLESIHSAIIDELTERHPKPRPELGLPVRKTEIALPDSKLDQTLLLSVDLDESRGIILFCFQSSFMSAIKLAPNDFWTALLKRTGKEFARRNIIPKFSQAELIEGPLQVHDRTKAPLRVIWIPFKIPAGTCYFGLAA